MKKISIAFLMLSATYLMQACNGNDSSSTDTTSMDSSSTANSSTNQMADTSTMTNQMADTSGAGMANTATSNAPLDKEATDFVMKAASGGMMEVELGKVAQDKGKSQRVKDFGSMMVTDHSKANDELKSLASSKNVTVPAALMPEHQKHVDMLKSKSGADFDKAYINMMNTDHKKDISEFKKASESATDADIKNFATKTLPVLQKHLDSVQAISHKM